MATAPIKTAASAPRYDYNTGKLLAPNQAQSTFNTQTGQRIGSPSTGGSSSVGSSYTPPRSGTTGNAAGSQAPIKPQVAALSGMTGNAAGSKLATGTVAANTKAANSAVSAVGAKPKWMTDLESVQSQKSSAPSSADNAFAANAARTNTFSSSVPQQQSVNPNAANALSAFAGRDARIAKDLAVYNSQNAQQGNPGAKYMTSVSENVAPSQPQPIQALQRMSTPIGSSTPVAQSSLGTIQKSAPSSSSSAPAFTPTTQGDNGLETPVAPASSSAAPKTPAKVSINNTVKIPTSQTAVQTAAAASDEAKNQAEAAAQAAATATNEEDKVYYTDLYNQAKSAADSSEAEYLALLAKSQEELDTQAQLDAETQALRLGQTDVAGQAIPLSFITGQQSALERRSLDRTAPLNSKLARLQASRNAALTAAQYKAGKAENRFGKAETNLNSITAEQRKRQQELADRSESNAISAADKAQAQANIDRKFEEDKRQYGLTYANQQRAIAIDQQNANTAATKATEKTGITDVQLKQEINKQLATPGFQKASEQERRNYILSQGGSPSDFGY